MIFCKISFIGRHAPTSRHVGHVLREFAESGVAARGHAMTSKLKAIALMASKLQDVLAVVLLVRRVKDRQILRWTSFVTQSWGLFLATVTACDHALCICKLTFNQASDALNCIMHPIRCPA
jgi:hypothetical protein